MSKTQNTGFVERHQEIGYFILGLRYFIYFREIIWVIITVANG